MIVVRGCAFPRDRYYHVDYNVWVQRTAEEVFMPLTVGGGVRSLKDIRDLLKAGADKVSINTAAIQLAVCAGIANPIPCAKGMIAVLIPAIRPRTSTSWFTVSATAFTSFTIHFAIA